MKALEVIDGLISSLIEISIEYPHLKLVLVLLTRTLYNYGGLIFWHGLEDGAVQKPLAGPHLISIQHLVFLDLLLEHLLMLLLRLVILLLLPLGIGRFLVLIHVLRLVIIRQEVIYILHSQG